MTVVLYNHHHAGDVMLSRTIIQDIVRANPGVEFELQCREKNAYLWRDLGLRLYPLKDGEREVSRGGSCIDLWFAHFGDMLVHGLTHRNQVETYNRQAVQYGLNTVPYSTKQMFVEIPKVDVGEVPTHWSVLVENGPVLSGQPVLEVNDYLRELAETFRGTTFYCTAKHDVRADNIRYVHNLDLIALSSLSELCTTMIARLSAVMVCSFTQYNHGRKRIVFGSPLGCPIWDEVGLVYANGHDALFNELRRTLV